MRPLSQMVFVSIVIGTAMSAAGTGRVDLSLVYWESLAWAFVPVIQLGTGLVLVLGRPGPLASRLTAYFETHRAWTLWLLTVAAALVVSPPLQGHVLWIAATIVIPCALTVRALAKVCSDDLGMTAETARRRVAIHQAMTWTVVAGYFGLSVALWPRIIDWAR